MTANVPAVASVAATASWVLLTNATAEPVNEVAPILTEAPDWKAVPLMVKICTADEAFMGLGLSEVMLRTGGGEPTLPQ